VVKQRKKNITVRMAPGERENLGEESRHTIKEKRNSTVLPTTDLTVFLIFIPMYFCLWEK